MILNVFLIIFFRLLLLLFFLFFISINGPFSSFTLLYKKYVVPHLSKLLGVSKVKPVTAFIAPFLFFTMLRLLIGGFLPYGPAFIVSLKVVFFICLSRYLIAFFYLILTENPLDLVWKKDFPLWLKIFIAPVELLSELIKPFSLSIRLYANIIFGHYILESVYFLVWYLGPAFYWLRAPLFVFELAVFIVQSYIFTYLVLIYFRE